MAAGSLVFRTMVHYIGLAAGCQRKSPAEAGLSLEWRLVF